MYRIPTGLFLLLLPVLFLGGCFASLQPVWGWMERGWIRPASELDKSRFPVLVRGADGVFAPASLGAIPPDSLVVTSSLDNPAINRDLNTMINSNADYKFFEVLDRTSDRTRVSLEVPTTRNTKLQTWYDIADNQIFPQKIMSYGSGFAFLVLPFTSACGLATVLVFGLIVRPKKKIYGKPET